MNTAFQQGYPPATDEDDEATAARRLEGAERAARTAADKTVRATRAVILFVVPTMIGACFLVFVHEDSVFWQLAEGRHMTAGRFIIPNAEALSYTAKGKLWTNYAWGASVVFYQASTRQPTFILPPAFLYPNCDR